MSLGLSWYFVYKSKFSLEINFILELLKKNN